MSAHGIGVVALIQPGVEIWSMKSGHAGADSIEDGQPGDPIGGVVVKVTEKINYETGVAERSFLCVDHTRTRPKLRFCTLVESEVDRTTVQVVDSAVLRRLWRRAGEDIAFSKRYHDRRGPAVAEEARLGLVLYELLGLVFGADGILHAALDSPAPPSRADVVERPSGPVNVSALVD